MSPDSLVSHMKHFTLHIWVSFSDLQNNEPLRLCHTKMLILERLDSNFFFIWLQVAFIHSIHIIMFYHWYNQLHLITIFQIFFSPCCSIDGVDHLIDLMQLSHVLPSSNHLRLSHVHSLLKSLPCMQRLRDVSNLGIMMTDTKIEWRFFLKKLTSPRFEPWTSSTI